MTNPSISIESPISLAFEMVLLGWIRRVVAISPNWRSRSTRQTLVEGLSANAAARFDAKVVLPQPPFAE